MTSRALATLLLTLASTAAAACGDGTATVDPGDQAVATVVVTAAAQALEAGATSQLTATARNAGGQVLPDRIATWSSDDSTVARVGSGGLVTAVRAGTVDVEATVEGKRGSVEIEVTTNPAPNASEISPASAIAGQGALTVTVRGAAFVPGARVLWNGEERPTTWVAPTELRAQLDGQDLADAGSAEVRVTNPGPGGGTSVPLAFTVSPVPVASVEVSPPSPTVQAGGTLALAATPRDALGRALDGRVVTWSSGREETATVSGTGVVTGVAAGTAAITATSEGVSGSVQVTVTAAPRVPVITSLTPDSVPATADSLTITIRGSGFTPASIAVAGTSRPSQYLSPTEMTLFFFSGDLARNGSIPVKVFNPGPDGGSSNTAYFKVRGINRVVVSGSAHLWTGEGAHFTARGTDQEGTEYPPQPVTWESENPDVASVDALGRVEGHAPGYATLRATMAGRTGSVGVRVLTPPVHDLLFEAPGGAGVPELWRASPGGDRPVQRVLPGVAARTPAASRDGQWIAFAGGDGQIHLVRADGTGLRRVTSGGGAKDQPAFSPDGTRLAYRERRGAEYEIGVVGVDGTGQRWVTWPREGVLQEWNQDPTWTPAGDRIVYSRALLLGMPLTLNLWSVAPDGSDPRALTTGSNSDTEAAFDPGGTMMAVARDWRNPPMGRQVTLLDPQGTVLGMIFAPGPGISPAWSPDGQWLAFLAPDGQGDMVDLVVTRPNDPLHKKVVSRVSNPVWIPGG